MSRGLAILCLLAAALSAPLPALERPSARASHERQTSTLEQVSVKPLMLFSMRERRDPFMAYALITTTAATDFFSITGLNFSGLIKVQGTPVALFKDNQGQTYSLKGSRLHGSDDKPLAGVRGRVSSDEVVYLEQGEKKIVYSAKSRSKRLEEGRSR